MFRRVVPLEAFDQAPGLGGGKGFVGRCGGVGVETILDQDDRFGLREVDVGQVFQNVGVIDYGAAVGDLTWRQPSGGANIMNKVATPFGLGILHADAVRRAFLPMTRWKQLARASSAARRASA